MCQSLHAMYEGKNIHYSAVDNKPLCSFSAKLCNQRRLNGYAFCVRHILEDPTAPFKRCAYVAKSSNQMCTQPIPRHEERQYCNNHMQVLGMLPRKERKPKKEKETNAIHDNRLSFEDRVKSKYNITNKIKNEVTTKQVSMDDPDDPYAFPDPVRDTPVVNNNVSPQPIQTLEVPPKQLQPSPNRAKSPGDGGSAIAKLYPELAEKLEKIKPKVEPKVKGRIRSSRTMNKLQTKIAQNKIKDKLRKSQESGSNPSVSPASLPSPDPAPVPSQPSNFVGQQATPPGPPPPLIRYDGAPHPPIQTTGPPLVPPQTTNLMGFPDMNHSVMPLAARLSPQILPPPYPGPTARLPTPSSQTPTTVPVPIPTVVPQPTPVVLPQTPLAAPPVPPPEPPPRLPPPPPYVAPPHPPLVSVNPRIPVLSTRPQQLKNVFVEKVARTKLKTNSAVDFYACYVRRKKFNHHLLSSGLCSSSEDESEEEDVDMLPWQPDWFSASSDDDNEEEQEGEELPIHVRATKLALLRARLRRQCYQSRKATCSNTSLQSYNNEATLALIKSARDSPVSTVKTLWEILKLHKKQTDRYKLRGLERRPCLYNKDEDEKCPQRALPYTNHCLKHIMYNVDQQLFDYCTAKFADNTQCCVPVFDIRHGLPLCAEHGAKVDNHQKFGDVDVKKRPRKKTKPPALTRPPKKGKKKKKTKYIRPQKPIPPSEPSGEITSFGLPAAVAEEEEEEEDDKMEEEEPDSPEPPEVQAHTSSQPIAQPSSTSTVEHMDTESPGKQPLLKVQPKQPEGKNMDQEPEGGALSSVPLEEMLPASGRIEDIDKTFGELPLEQASRLLEEQDFQDVFNRIPDDAFDIFSGKNGDYEPTLQETEELERALDAATKDVYSAKDTLEKLVKGDMSEELSAEWTKTISDVLLAHTMQNTGLVDPNLSGESVPADVIQEGINALSRNLASGVNTNFSPTVPPTVNSLILNRIHSMSYPQGQTSAVPYNGAITSNSAVPGQSTRVESSNMTPGFQAAISAQNIGTTLANRTTIAPQRGFQNSQGVAHAGYHGNLPYSALSQQLAMSQQPSKGQAIPNTTAVGQQLRMETAHVLPRATLPPQSHHSQQTVLPPQLAGARPPWPPQSSVPGATSVNYQNGFPVQVTQAPFIQTVNLANQVGKFPASAQANMTAEFANKQDPHFASLTHSIGVPTIRAPVQGFVTNFPSAMPPFTSSSNGS